MEIKKQTCQIGKSPVCSAGKSNNRRHSFQRHPLSNLSFILTTSQTRRILVLILGPNSNTKCICGTVNILSFTLIGEERLIPREGKYIFSSHWFQYHGQKVPWSCFDFPIKFLIFFNFIFQRILRTKIRRLQTPNVLRTISCLSRDLPSQSSL